MTRSVYDPDKGTWADEDGDFAAGITNALILTAAAGFLVLLVWNVFLALRWVL